MLFGVDIAHPSALGHHEVRLNSVTLIGPRVSAENWYLGIVEEFLLVLPGADTQATFHLAERLRHAVMAIAHPELDGRTVTVSIGIASFAEGEDFKLAFKRADEALYSAKGQGRNCVVCAE